MNRSEFLAVLSEHGHSVLAQEIAPSVRDSIRLVATRTPNGDGGIPVGASKFGGSPDVPDGFIGPMHGETPLTLLLQLNLAELALFDSESLLPSDGHLLFFYDTVNNPWDDGWQVVYFPGRTPLHRAEEMRALDVIAGQDSGLIPALAHFEPSFQVDTHSWDRVKAAVSEPLFAALEQEHKPKQPFHQVLGYPRPIQTTPNQMAAQCEADRSGINVVSYYDPEDDSDVDYGPDYFRQVDSAHAKIAADWVALFQIDGDDEIGWGWGDSGMLYFLIHREDLNERRFEAVRFVGECC